jgi:hypothetical protein
MKIRKGDQRRENLRISLAGDCRVEIQDAPAKSYGSSSSARPNRASARSRRFAGPSSPEPTIGDIVECTQRTGAIRRPGSF